MKSIHAALRDMDVTILIGRIHRLAVLPMHGGNSSTREKPLGIDWRPLLASFCLHFLLALSVGFLLGAAIEPPRQSISLARVTLQTPANSPQRFEGDDHSQAEWTSAAKNGESTQDSATPLPGPTEAPLQAASLHLAAVPPGIGAPLAASGLTSRHAESSIYETPKGGGLLNGKGGNTEADERLMSKDIERYLASQPPSGPSTEVSLFGGKMTGHSFVFVIDRSASTASKHYSVCAEIERQCAQAIDGLPEANRFGLVLYNERLSAGNGLKLASKKEKDAVKERMVRFSPYGGTQHLDGLRAALLQRPNVVCWFSDGGDPYLSARQVEELALLAARSKTVVHAWRIGDRPADLEKDFMRTLAERTGGEFHEGIPTAK